MTSLFKKAVLTVVLTIGLVLSATAQDPAIKAAGRTVELSLIVTGPDKKAVAGIRKEDIQLTEDKVKQTVLSISADERPVDFGLLIDASSSMQKLLNASLETARLLIENRRPGEQLFVESFVSSDNIRTVQDFTTDGDLLTDSLKAIIVEGGQSAIIDAVYLGGEHIAKQNGNNPGRRKVLILLTDGEDRNSYYKNEDLIKKLQTLGVQVFAIGFITELDSDDGFIRRSPKERAEKFLKDLTSETGGRVFFPRKKKDLLEAMNQIVADLRSQFRLTYESTSDKKGFRKVDVKLTPAGNEKLAAVLPRGYFFPN